MISHRFRTLHAGLNEFTELESDALKALPNLREFTMEGCDVGANRLIIEGGAFRNNPLLETVNITKCRGLDHVPSGTLASQLHLSTINLSGNMGRATKILSLSMKVLYKGKNFFRPNSFHFRPQFE